MSLISQTPSCWYIAIATAWSIYQGSRGVIEQKLAHNAKVFIPSLNTWVTPREPTWSCTEQWFILYIHDFVFRFICTAAGFLSLYISYAMFSNTECISTFSAGAATLIASSFLLGVIGVGGQLHFIILMGRVPR